ncbi:hypothetical protein [Halococcus sp. AFM35]|uniref:hypothetical protein n=1 Tax=Halococcus sp. AFM35 TaxID=3421653 RepID=UPI003EB7FD01
MKRRELLRDLFLAGGAFTVAGCLGGDGEEDGSSPDGTDTARTANGEPTTAGPAPTTGPATTEPSETSPTNEPRATNTTGATETTGEPIPIPDAPAGGEKNTSVGGTTRVTFRGNGSRIVVQGTIVGQDGCRTAVLESVQGGDSGLVVTVATERAATTGRACTMALVDIDYRFTIRRDSPPASVTVVHRGATGERTVTTATP